MRAIRLLALAAYAGATLAAVAPAGAAIAHPQKPPSHADRVAASREVAAADAEELQSAAADLVNQALAAGALHRAPSPHSPAKRLFLAAVALEQAVRHDHPSLQPADTTRVMGPVPAAFTHDRSGRPHHRKVWVTHVLRRWTGATVPAHPSGGVGHNRPHDGRWPAVFQAPDGVYVDPHLPWPAHPTVGEVAIHAALAELGQPYVWAGGGPRVFDCSGLVQWAYAKAGIPLGHYTGWQWNEGRLIHPRDVVPGDLVLFGNPTHHVGIYLGAGWMVNAPYTGGYVDVAPVGPGVAGIIRP